MSDFVAAFALAIRPDVLQSVQFWIYLLCWIPYTAFVVLYARSPWRSSSTGVGLMTVAGSMVAVLTNALATVILGPAWPYRDVMRLIFLGCVAAAGWFQLKNLIVLQHKARRGTPAAPPHLVSSDDRPGVEPL